MISPTHPAWIRFARCNRIPFGVRNRVLRLLVGPEKQSDGEFDVDFHGFTYRGNRASYIDWMVYYYGAYEYQELRLLQNILTEIEACTVLDVGANVGQHSLYLSQYSGIVHAFEPYMDVAQRIQEKIRMNGLDNVILHQVGLGSAPGSLPFMAPAGHNHGMGSFVAGNGGREIAADSILLPVYAGDAYLEEHRIKDIGLIKIDVEGFEIEVLKGLHATLTRDRPIVYMEYSRTTKAACADDVLRHFPEGYALYPVVTTATTYRIGGPPKHPEDGNILVLPHEMNWLLPRLHACRRNA